MTKPRQGPAFDSCQVCGSEDLARHGRTRYSRHTRAAMTYRLCRACGAKSRVLRLDPEDVPIHILDWLFKVEASNV